MKQFENKNDFALLSKFIETKSNRDFFIHDIISTPEEFRFNCPYMNDGFIFMIILNGCGVLNINFKEYTVYENTIIVLNPHSVLEIIKLSDDVLVRSFFFSFDLIADLHLLKDYDAIAKINKYPCIEVSEQVMDDVEEFYDFVVKQYYNIDVEYRKQMVSALINALTLKIGTIYKITKVNENAANSSRQESLVDNFIKLLLVNYREQRTIGFYADKLYLTAKYLSKVVKEVTGKPMLFWINSVLIVDAKFKLKTTDMSVKQISDDLGFLSPTLFGRFFKQYVGMTPQLYRKNG